VDDLEKLLEESNQPEQLYTVKQDYQTPLIAIIKAFQSAQQSQSRLLLTSRYGFELLDTMGTDMGQYLYKLSLPSMNEIEAKKQYRIKYARQLQQEKNISIDPIWIIYSIYRF